jgi:hypothetical protein
MILVVSKQKSPATWRSTWEKYLPYLGAVVVAINLVLVVDDIYAGKPYLVQLAITVALAAAVVYALVYKRRQHASKSSPPKSM